MNTSQYKLYNELGIIIATFFGGFLAGGFLISRNYKRLGEYRNALISMSLGVIGTCFFFIIMHRLPTEQWNLPSSVYYIPQFIIVGFILQITQKRQLKFHIENEGKFESNWKAFGISLLFLLLALILFIAITSFFGIEI